MFTKIIVIAVATACTVNGFSLYGQDYVRTPLGDAIDKASMKMLNEAYKSADDKNVVCSPLGVMTLLSLYAEGAGPQSKREIDQYLGASQNQSVSLWYSDLSRRLAAEDPSYLTVANKIYVSNKFNLNDHFASVAMLYDSAVDTIDFVNAEAAAAIINRWADEKTKGHITDPVKPESLDPHTAAALFNVIFFQGHWHVPFLANETVDKDFHVDATTTVKKPTMHLLKPLFFTENKEIGARMIELPYKENGFRMVIVLPDDIDGLPKVLDKVVETGLLTDVFKLGPANCDVDLDMPKFEVRSRLDLTKILPKIGMTKMFQEEAPRIVKDDTVVVSDAFQEAVVKVDEEGATAGAFTGFVLVAISDPPVIPPPIKFSVDRPFLYLILHQDKIVFAGTYSH